jgi:glycerophosphoryl diester phosphodiesterase
MRIPTWFIPAALLLTLPPAVAAAFDLQGHRGARGLAPENTLAGFATALGTGVSTLEMDIGVTKDGVVVVSHNRRLNPDLTRDRRGNWLNYEGQPIYWLKFDELEEFDVGRIDPKSRIAPGYADQVAADGERIPKLADVFALVAKAGNTEVRFNIETKLSPLVPEETAPPDEMVERLLEAVQAAGMLERVTVQSFDWRTLVLAKQKARRIKTSCLTAEEKWLDNVQRGQSGPSPWTASLDIDRSASLPDLVLLAGCAVWSPFHEDLSLKEFNIAKALGLEVIPWTVNEPDRMRQLIELGVDGLITDYPDKLAAVLRERRMPVPKPTPVKR